MEKAKFITDKEAFYARLLKLLQEGNYTFINTLTGKVIYLRESFPDNGEFMVDEGFGETDRYLINIAHIDVSRPKSRSVHHVFEDLLQGWAKAVVILIMLMVPMFSNAQIFDFNREKAPSAVYIAYQPWDHGLGLRYDHHFWRMGTYGSVTYGDLGLYRAAGYTNHVKLTAGILIPMREYNGSIPDISAGLNYHYVEEFKVNDPRFHKSGIISYPWSFELGLTVKLRRISIGVRTDILRWEPCIDVGIPIKVKNR